MEDGRGRKYVEKQGNSEGHIAEEHYANNVYEAMGVPVPKQDLVQVNGVNTQRANYIEDGVALNDWLYTATTEEEAAMKWQLQQPFALDALLGNWDVIGLEGDNIIIKDGVAYRVDNGGSLRYRAQGALKSTDHPTPSLTQPFGGQWSDTVGELETMRSKGNKWQKYVFGDLSDADLRRQILDLADRRTELLAALPPELRQIVGARLNSMLDQTEHITPSAETTVHVTPEVRTPGYQTLNEYDHEYLTKFYNDLAGELNTRGSGGYKEWTAADAAILAGRSRELRGRPEGTVLNQAELDRATTNITPGVYPSGDSEIAHLAPGLQLLNQRRNRVQRHTFITGVNHDTARAIRDEYGIMVENSDDIGVGGFDQHDQPMQSVQTLANPQQARDMADVLSYATRTPDMITFINDATPDQIVKAGKNFRDYTAQGVIVLPESLGPRMMDKVQMALGEKLPWGTRGMKSREVPGVGRRIEIIDHDGNFPRDAVTGEVNGEELNRQLEETLNAIEGAPDTSYDMSVEYGSHHISGPERQPDGTYDWEGYGDAVHRDLSTRGTTAGRESLDRVRDAYNTSVKRHFRDASPQNSDRLDQGLPPSHELEDRRGGQVLGTTTPSGITSGVIRGFGAADPLTGLHELVHLFSIAGGDGSLRDAVSRSWHERVTAVEQHAANLEAQAAAATNASVATRLRNDAAAARAGLGTTDPAVWGKAQEEHLVQVLFEWIDKGVPINPDMRNVTEHFRNWIDLTRKSTRQRGMPPVEVSPAMEGVFNRMSMRPGVETVPYSIEDQAMRMAMQQVVKSSWDEAHATQFYKHDRSMVERSINHPYIGLYPASYMWGKVLPEMVRFLALRPFGMETPFLAWNVLREVSDSIRSQSETDDHFKKFLSDNKDAFMLMSMFFPSLPQDTPANLSLPVRRIAEQGLENQLKYAQGADPKSVGDIDYAKGASDAMFYALGPAGTIRTVNQSLGMAGNFVRSGMGALQGTLQQQQPEVQTQDVLPLR
jgi:hypothetical protein